MRHHGFGTACRVTNRLPISGGSRPSHTAAYLVDARAFSERHFPQNRARFAKCGSSRHHPLSVLIKNRPRAR